MAEEKRLVCWRETEKIVASLDALADAKGIDRSDVLRMMVREKLEASADSK